MKADPKFIKDFEEQLTRLYDKMSELSPIHRFTISLKEAINQIKEGGEKNIGSGIEKVSRAFLELSPHLNKIGKDLEALFGEETGQDIQSIVQGFEALAETGMGVSKVMQGDLSGIFDVVSGVSKLLGHASKVNKEHREALKLLELQRKEQEHAYQIAVLQSQLAYKKGDTVYGSDQWGKANNATKVYNSAIQELSKSEQELDSIQIKTGSKKKGWGFWKKHKDVYDGILKVYPQLINNEGKVDKAMAQTILSTRSMSDAHKFALQAIIDNIELVESAYAEMKNYLTDLFGDIADSIMNAFVESFKGSKDAMQDFYESSNKMLENLITDFIKSVRLAPLLEKANKEVMDYMSSSSYTDEEKNKKMMDVTAKLIDSLINSQNTIDKDLAYYQKYIQQKYGRDIFTEKEYKQTASSRTLEGVSQDVGMEISGRMAAVHINTEKMIEWMNRPITLSPEVQRILERTISLSDISLKALIEMEVMRTIQLNSYYVLTDIDKNTKELYSINREIKRLNTKLEKL